MRVRTTGVSFFDEGDKGKAKIESIETDENGSLIFNYIITFKVDARNVIQGGATSARLIIRNNSVQESFGLFDGVDGSSPGAVLDAVLNATARNKAQIAINKNSGVIIKKNVDLTTIVSNSVASNLALFNDNDAFGSKRVTSLMKPMNTQNPSRFPALQKNLAANTDIINGADFEVDTENFQDVDDRDFTSGYKLVLYSEKDPGALVKPKKIVTTLMNSIEGTLPVRRRGVDNFFIDQLSTAISKTFMGQYRNVRSLADYVPDQFVPIMTVTSNRIKSIDVRIPLSNKSVMESAMLNVAVDIIDSKGVVQETKAFLIEAVISESNFTLTDKDPMVRIGNLESGNYVITTSKSDISARGVIVFVRNISETASLLEGKFTQLKKFLDAPEATTAVPTIHRLEYRQGSRSRKTFSIFRAVQALPDGRVLGNFTSATLPVGVYTNYHCVIYTGSTSEGISVTVSRLPENVKYVEILRRDTSIGQREYESIYKEDEIEPRGLLGRLNPLVRKEGAIINAIDYLVKRDHIYEYRCRLFYKNGLTKLSSTTRTQKHVPPTGLSTVEITDLTTTSVGSSQSVTFNVAGEQIPSATDILIEAIQNAGLSELFNDDLAEIRTSLKNIIVFDIERFDYVTGETYNMGVFPAGPVTDSDPINGPKRGRSYTYRAHALLRSPLELLEEIRTSFIDAQMPQGELADPSARLARSSPDPIDPNFSDKFYSRSSFRRGTLSYGSALGALTTAQDRFEKDPTGDTASAVADMRSGLPTVTNIEKKYVIGKGVLVSWSASGNSEIIDFFAVASERPDGRFVAGACHNVNNNGYYLFIDRSIKGYEGSVSYHITPVFLDGTIGTTKKSSQMILRNER